LSVANHLTSKAQGVALLLKSTGESAGEQEAIFVIDRDPSSRASLAAALRAHGHRVVPMADAQGFITMLGEGAAAAVLIDVGASSPRHLQAISDVCRAARSAPVFVMAAHATVPMAVEAIKRGAEDVIEKPFDAMQVVRRVLRALSQAGDEEPAEPPRLRDTFGTLTAREVEVLEQIALGASSKEAGRLLGISPRTIEVHRARILKKLDARNTADLMRIVFSVVT
jgi:two-component system, LuxR family, response regulator FixJ